MTITSLDNEITDSIYILLTDTGTLFTRLIKGFTGAPYNHASLVLDENLEEIYSFGRKRVNNPLHAGFVKEDVYQGTFRHFPETRCRLLRIAVTEQQKTALLKVISEFEKDKNRYRYNLIGLIGVLLEMDLQPAHSYFCSQFVAETLRSSGIQMWDHPSTLVTPNDFLVHESVQVIYDGPLYEYPKLDRQRLGQLQKPHYPTVLFGKRAV
ncbi:hypothetical protein [Paenibacillus sp. LHD-38]|uniref:hypothetical protein n=1 Tax=Paenibacillus sp. LHD-38 TaxID=3072143 RepID=UPI00280C94C1|nr:hypothetical protein [Paenibacillus sp. LHD-38]MDQ8733761.1 hypothetical protein [Paenibacillus sp. LHD-38]